ncbi:MAG: universal stress protein [Acidimicrobiia bacterium]
MIALIALDESAISVRAAREARHLFPNAEFLVINVGRGVVPWLAAGQFGMVYPAPAPMIEEAMPDDELETLAESAGVHPTDVITVVGDPGRAICDAAEQHDVDVIVVGSHDKGVFRRLIEPSVAQAVLHNTHRPVLIVGGTKADEAATAEATAAVVEA